MSALSSEDLIERLALSFIKGVNAEIAQKIVEVFDNLHNFFTFNIRDIKKITEAGPALNDLMLQRQEALEKAKSELSFIEKHNIKFYNCIDESEYPYRLYNSADPPVNLFVLGNADLNAHHILAVVGTRRATPYGLTFTSQIIEELVEAVGPVTIVSGLAYGIDKASHEAALRIGVPTVAVVAHGLGMIYPALHRRLASDIIKNGGAIVSEYPHDAQPYRGRFLERNRIVAGLSDAVFVAESSIKGGALNTAAHARHNDREVLALPGRVTDLTSQGCNYMINRQLALLATSGKDIAYANGWDLETKSLVHESEQTSLLANYTGDVKIIYDFLREQPEPVTIDKIIDATSIAAKDIMAALGEIDMDGFLARYPGARFGII